MFCCALGTVILAALALWRKRLRGLLTAQVTAQVTARVTARATARAALACLLVIGLALAGLLLVTEHFGHALALADGKMQDTPLCGATNAKE